MGDPVSKQGKLTSTSTFTFRVANFKIASDAMMTFLMVLSVAGLCGILWLVLTDEQQRDDDDY